MDEIKLPTLMTDITIYQLCLVFRKKLTMFILQSIYCCKYNLDECVVEDSMMENQTSDKVNQREKSLLAHSQPLDHRDDLQTTPLVSQDHRLTTVNHSSRSCRPPAQASGALVGLAEHALVLPSTHQPCRLRTDVVHTHTLRTELGEEGRTEQARIIQDNSVGRGPVCVMANLSSLY